MLYLGAQGTLAIGCAICLCCTAEATQDPNVGAAATASSRLACRMRGRGQCRQSSRGQAFRAAELRKAALTRTYVERVVAPERPKPRLLAGLVRLSTLTPGLYCWFSMLYLTADLGHRKCAIPQQRREGHSLVLLLELFAPC